MQFLRFHLMVTFAGASFSPQNTHFSKHFPPILRGNLNAISAISPDGHFKIFVRQSGPFPRGSYPDLLRNFWLSLYGLTRKSKSSLAFWIELNIYLQPWANKFLLHLENLLARADAATHFLCSFSLLFLFSSPARDARGGPCDKCLLRFVSFRPASACSHTL